MDKINDNMIRNSLSVVFFSDVFYKLVKSQPGAQYDPKIGMFRSNCLKVCGMSISYQVLLSKSV